MSLDLNRPLQTRKGVKVTHTQEASDGESLFAFFDGPPWMWDYRADGSSYPNSPRTRDLINVPIPPIHLTYDELDQLKLNIVPSSLLEKLSGI